MTVSDEPIEPAGDRPRSGGLVDTSLFSNIASRLRTPPDILTDSQKVVAWPISKRVRKGGGWKNAEVAVKSCSKALSSEFYLFHKLNIRVPSRRHYPRG